MFLPQKSLANLTAILLALGMPFPLGLRVAIQRSPLGSVGVVRQWILYHDWLSAVLTLGMMVSGSPTGIKFDGAGTVTKLRASDGVTVGAFTLSGGRSVTFDGVNIWVASGNFVSRF